MKGLAILLSLILGTGCTKVEEAPVIEEQPKQDVVEVVEGPVEVKYTDMQKIYLKLTSVETSKTDAEQIISQYEGLIIRKITEGYWIITSREAYAKLEEEVLTSPVANDADSLLTMDCVAEAIDLRNNQIVYRTKVPSPVTKGSDEVGAEIQDDGEFDLYATGYTRTNKDFHSKEEQIQYIQSLQANINN